MTNGVNEASQNFHHNNVTSSDEEYLSDYVQKHTVPLPHLAHEADNLDGDTQSIKSNGTDGDWQENWLFKKKNTTNNSISTSPIAMLVPSPTEDVKTLIGDKNADEISDLSEAGSAIDSESENGDGLDDDEINRANLDIPYILVESKTIIGGKNEVESFEESSISVNELLQPGSLVSVQSLTTNSPVILEAKNNLILLDIEDERTGKLGVDDNQNEIKSIAYDTIDEIIYKAQKSVSSLQTDGSGVETVDLLGLLLAENYEKPATTVDNKLNPENNNNVVHLDNTIECKLEEAPVPAPR